MYWFWVSLMIVAVLFAVFSLWVVFALGDKIYLVLAVLAIATLIRAWL